MNLKNGICTDVKIAYIGGGSRGWAWTLMTDLAKVSDMTGTVYLYDLDYDAACVNEAIGNRVSQNWHYVAVSEQHEALAGADFVVVSILPGTFDEMEYDVHTPEKYGIYQSVGDTIGPGGFFRAMRTVPMMRDIARAVREHCPQAWVINYTNPMAVCVKALYKEFPEIKAFGCCHEVFGTQALLSHALEEICGISGVDRRDIHVNVIGVNHFTWFTEGKYKNQDLFPIYDQFCSKFYDHGYLKGEHSNWANNSFTSGARIRMDLYKRFGYIAAAGDRHLAEFCPTEEYLADPETVKSWCFGLTPVSWRKKDLQQRLARSHRLYTGEEAFSLQETGEEGTEQMRALLGQTQLVTNINIPNQGQIPNLPLGSIVETNAVLSGDCVRPVFAGNVPDRIYPRIHRICLQNDRMVEAAFQQDLRYCFEVFSQDHMLESLTPKQKQDLFQEMYQGTKSFLSMYT